MMPAWALNLPWDLINQYSESFDLDPHIVASIAQVESAGNGFAMRYEPGYRWLYEVKQCAKLMRDTVFSRTAYTDQTEEQLQKFSWGLLQIMGAVAREHGLDEPMPVLLDIDANLFYGCRYLYHLKTRYKGNMVKAIAAYNAGSARYDNSGKLVNFDYVHRVMELNKVLGG